MTDAQLDALLAENEPCAADYLDAARRCHEVFPGDPVRWCYPCRETALVLALREAREERDAAAAKVLRVLHGEFANICGYCGWESPQPASWENLQAHIHACEQHPVTALNARAEQAEAEVARLRAENERLINGLRDERAALKATGGQP